MDQVLVYRNKCFDNIFMVDNNQNLCEGLTTKLFEIFLFKKLSRKDEYDVLDSADRQQKNDPDTSSNFQQVPTRLGKLSILDILLVLKTDHQLQLNGVTHTIYLHTAMMDWDDQGSKQNHDMSQSFARTQNKPKKLTMELEITVLDVKTDTILL